MATVLKTGYAVYPSVKMKELKTNSKTGKKELVFLKELLFGDYIKPYIVDNAYETVTVTEGKNEEEVEYIKVKCRGADGYIKASDMQANRILEVNFIDVGQGDGCHIVTPDDKHFLIDSGGSDNMYRFLKWRFNLTNKKKCSIPFTVVMSHSDTDHYLGFGKIFGSQTDESEPQFSISKIYHNGMIEASGSEVDALGTVVTQDDCKYITDLCDTNDDYENRIQSGVKRGYYITTLTKSSAPKEALRLGSAPIYDKKDMKMEIVGPVAETIEGKDALVVFGNNKGKTKNGHSVVVRLTIGHLRLLLGGDLNTESEYHLLHHFSGVDIAAIKTRLKDKSIPDDERQALTWQLDEAIVKA